MKQFIEMIGLLIICSMIEHLPVSQSISLQQLDADNEALINEYFSSEKVDEAAEHCLRLFSSKPIKSNHNSRNNEDNLNSNSLNYAARKLKWRYCIIKELDRINRGLYQWNIGSLFKFNEGINNNE